MKATLKKFVKKSSRYGGHFYYAFFSDNKDKSYYTCLYPKMRNFTRWSKVLKEGLVFSNLKLVKGKNNLIDADSRFKIVEK